MHAVSATMKWSVLALTLLLVGLPGRAAATSPVATRNVDVVGHIGGHPAGVAVQGSAAYLLVGARLLVLDTGDPARPRLLGQSPPLRGATYGAGRVAVSGAYAYVGNPAGLQVVRVDEPTDPRLVGAVADPRNVRDLAVSGALALLVAEGALNLVDVSDPTRPRLVSTYHDSDPLADVAAVGSVAYVVGEAGLRAIDVAEASSPRQIGALDLPGAQQVAVGAGLAYVLHGVDPRTGRGTLSVVDIADPTRPTRRGAVEVASGQLAPAGARAYLAGGNLVEIDATNPSAPRANGLYQLSGSAFDLAIANGLAYAVEPVSLRIITLANPTALSAYAAGLNQYSPVAAAEPYLYALGGASELLVVDLTDPDSPTTVGRTPISTGGSASWYQGQLTDGKVYVPGGLGVSIVDVSAPTAPRELGMIRTTSSVPGLAVVGRYAYLAEVAVGLRIYDVADPAQPRALGAYQSTCGATASCNARDVEVAGGYAVVHGATTPEVVDVSDPARPRAVGALSSHSTDFDFDGSYAYALCGQEGARVVDLTDPTSPRTIAKLTSAVGCAGVESVGPRLYLSGDTGLRIVDVSDPRCPIEVGGHDILAQSLGNSRLVVGHSLLFVDEGPAGVYLLRPTGPAALLAPPAPRGGSRTVLPMLGQRSAAPGC